MIHRAAHAFPLSEVFPPQHFIHVYNFSRINYRHRAFFSFYKFFMVIVGEELREIWYKVGYLSEAYRGRYLGALC